MRLKIRRLKELKAFNSLRLPVEDTAEAAAKVLIKLAGETKLAQTELARTELMQTKLIQTELVQTELIRTELMAIRYWNSLKS